MTPDKAWSPLPESEWTRDHARHLASRIGYSVRPDLVEEIYQLGPQKTVQQKLLAQRPMPPISSYQSMRDAVPQFKQMAPEERREARRELQKTYRKGYDDYAVEWFAFAAQPENSPQEKLTAFFQNVWVVAFQAVKNVPELFDYQATIRSNLGASYPEMCSKLAFTRAMAHYLNLNKNKKDAPNENFARELLELFTLGEGNYTETDIKEIARALTGYSFPPGKPAVFRKQRHDGTPKTIFGEKGNHQWDDVLRLIFEQPAASQFLPKEFCHFYLTEDENQLDDSLFEQLGSQWAASGFDLPTLYTTILSSRLFYAPEYRANLIKSPNHLFIGLHQDFELNISPLASDCVRLTRTMGQAFFNPPNVKGWDGGKRWINSATLSARRNFAETLMRPINEEKLNANEVRDLEAAREKNPDARYRLDVNTYLRGKRDPQEAARFLAERLFANGDPASLSKAAERFFGDADFNPSAARRALMLAALASPSYQLA